jgi:uncharacterized membrane protein YheB (UPF0754 family)
MFYFNKSLWTNIIALAIAVIGVYLANEHIRSIGFYALSGAITNWIAIYMLFEKIPFLYGSGIIPNKFESFKKSIRSMIMEQFFSKQNMAKFLGGNSSDNIIKNVIENKLDYNKIFDGFIDAIMSSSYGSMIDMFLGGRVGLESLREKFILKMEIMISDLLNNLGSDSDDTTNLITSEIEKIIDTRLSELTPDLVKEIIQQMIRDHLGWLVIWGGVFGGIIGLLASYF